MKQKYFSHKTRNQYGEFDSKQEYERYLYLLNRKNNKEIYGLRRQVRFQIIPKLIVSQIVKLKTKTKIVEKVDEKAAYYTCDFVYYDNITNYYVMEELKSIATKNLDHSYPLRRKLIKKKIELHNKKKNNWIFNEVVYGKSKKRTKDS